MPGDGASSGGKNKGSTRAIAMRALGTRMRTFLVEVKEPDTRMADAALASAVRKYASLSAKVRSPARARSADVKPVSGIEPSPRTSPRSCSAIWAAVKGIKEERMFRLKCGNGRLCRSVWVDLSHAKIV